MRPALAVSFQLVLPVFLLLASVRPLAAALARGAVWFETGFENTNDLASWQGPAGIAPGFAGDHAVGIVAAPPANGAVITRPLPVESVRGCVVRGSLMVRAENVSAKPNPWNGIKCMLVVERATGTDYPQAPLETGSFDWQRAGFTARIPDDAKRVTLVLGLEQVSGKVWFDDLRFVISRAPAPRPAPVAGPPYKGHDLPRLRGAMISPSITPESLKVLGGDWNANLIRWQLIRTTWQGGSLDDAGYDAWLESELKKLDAALPHCERLGVSVVVDLHSPPGGKGTSGGYAGSDARLFTDPACQQKFVALWRSIATRYRDAKPVWGYDLANEPVEDNVAENCADWQELAERAARAIREADPRRTIIVEPSNWGGPDGLKDLVPIPVSNVVYSVHVYLPHQFTHQNVHGKTPEYTYPGEIEGKPWDKAALERALQPVVDFQNRYNVHMYIGEFSAIRWAPDESALRYLRDLIDIFEARGWDWSYHAFREWHGWSVEHTGDRNDTRPAAAPTERQKLLREWFARNQKPRW